MALTKRQIAARDEAREHLRDVLKPGDTVYTVLRHVSRSGMSHSIDLYKVEADDQERDGARILWLSGWAAQAMGRRQSTARGPAHEAIVIGGCGMDMGFALVYDLSHALYGEGYQCTGPRCPSADHNNNPPRPPADGTMFHQDGYALSHRWL